MCLHLLSCCPGSSSASSETSSSSPFGYSATSLRPKGNQNRSIELKDLSPATATGTCTTASITTQSPNHHCSSLNLSPSPSLLVLNQRPTTPSLMMVNWNNEEGHVGAQAQDQEEHYDVDDYEERTPTMWRAWWLNGAPPNEPTAFTAANRHHQSSSAVEDE